MTLLLGKKSHLSRFGYPAFTYNSIDGLTPRRARLADDVDVGDGEDSLPVADAAVEPVAVDAAGQRHHLAWTFVQYT